MLQVQRQRCQQRTVFEAEAALAASDDRHAAAVAALSASLSAVAETRGDHGRVASARLRWLVFWGHVSCAVVARPPIGF